jgi:hypothetical protein
MSKAKIFFLFMTAVLALFIAGAPTQASIHGSFCPMGGNAGCPAPNGGTVQNSNLFASLPQSGQAYGNTGANTGCPTASISGRPINGGGTSGCRPSHDVAGVDYPVGAWTPTASLLDPAIPANVPANCLWSLTGANFNSHAPHLVCGQNAALGFTVQGLNFGTIGGHGCAFLETKSGWGQTTVVVGLIQNNRFGQDDAGCSGQAYDNQGGIASAQIYENSGRANSTLNVLSNTFDGTAASNTATSAGLGGKVYAGNYVSSGVVNLKYNAYIRMPGHINNTLSVAGVNTTVNETNNYIACFDINGLEHSETSGEGDAALTVQYNTYYTCQDMASTGQTLYYVNDNSSIMTGPLLIDSNVFVTNTIGGSPYTTSSVVTGHLDNSIFTLDAITGGSATALFYGQGISNFNLNLNSNTNSNTGVGGTWTTHCSIQSPTQWCPFATLNNAVQPVAPSPHTFAGVGNYAAGTGDLTITSVSSGYLAVGDFTWRNDSGAPALVSSIVLKCPVNCTGETGVYQLSVPQNISATGAVIGGISPTVNAPATHTFAGTGTIAAQTNTINITATGSGFLAVGDIIYNSLSTPYIVPGTQITSCPSTCTGETGSYGLSAFQSGSGSIPIGGTSNVRSGVSAGLPVNNFYGNFVVDLGHGQFQGGTTLTNNFLDSSGSISGVVLSASHVDTSAANSGCSAGGGPPYTAQPTTFGGNVLMTSGSQLASLGNALSVNAWSAFVANTGCQ